MKSDNRDNRFELLNNTYLTHAKKYGEIIQLSLIKDFIPLLLDAFKSDNRYKIECLMLPDWATKAKMHLVGKNWFTHIRIKEGLK